MIRAATTADTPVLQAIELAAGAQFRALGMHAVADDEPSTTEELEVYVEAGRAWVWADVADRVLGYVVTSMVDGEGHVDQVSVEPRHQGRGIGRALLAGVDAWAAEFGGSAVTLTTFVDVPWNQPLYEHLGYRSMAPGELGPELAAIRAAETARGLDRWPRVAMIRGLPD